MTFEIVWSDFAEIQLDKIFDYYVENASLLIAQNLIRKIIAEPTRLIESPEISQVEELLLDRENKYRSLVFENYKIIYFVDQQNSLIKIADIFDTRQNPGKIKRTK